MATDIMSAKPRAEKSEALATQMPDVAGDQGSTTIAESVVAKIAGIAAREIDGVHRLVTTGVISSFAGFAQRLARSDQRSVGVAAEVGQKEAAIDLALEVDYGVPIRRVCEQVRRNVAARIESMTGLRVKEVNILVADLYFPGEETTPDRRVE